MADPSIAPPGATGTVFQAGHSIEPDILAGWSGNLDQIPNSLIKGIDNEQVWLLVRRLDMTTFHIKTLSHTQVGGLDLHVAPDQVFSPIKMRSEVERLYMGVLLGVLSGVKQLSRLRSWNERRRTATFCILYFLMWWLDYLALSFVMLCITLLAYPRARTMLFPPAPMALVGSLSGSATKPNAGILGSADSTTGAPEHFTGEAVEREAGNFVNGLGSIAANICGGSGDPQGEPNTKEDGLKSSLNASPDEVAVMVASAKAKAEGVDKPSQDKTKKPMVTIMWSKVLPVMHVMTRVSNVWERLANLLRPLPPFAAEARLKRLQLIAVLLPLAVASVFTSRDLLYRIGTFILGAMLFGKPVIAPIGRFTFSSLPNLLEGCPTNAQLALALLRLGEVNSAPIPPCPRISGPPSDVPLDLTEDVLDAADGDQPLGLSDDELQDVIAADEDTLSEAGGNDAEVTKSDSKEPHKVLRLAKRATKVGIRTFLAVDKVRGKLGNAGAKNRAGVVPSKQDKPIAGPFEFTARYEGDRGVLTLGVGKATSTLSFHKGSATEPNRHTDATAVWSLPVNDIVELRKHSGLGLMTTLATGWALDKELSNSLGITDKLGRSWAVTALPHRDALFNRLIAVGVQKWEIR